MKTVVQMQAFLGNGNQHVGADFNTDFANYATPAQCTTMPCFSGEDFKTWFFTSARHGRKYEELQRYPDSGCVFSMRVDVPGLPVHFFAD